MATYAELDTRTWSLHLDGLREGLRACTTLERAAQLVARSTYERFAESTALARVYAIVKYGELPADVKGFVDGLASSTDRPGRLAHDTPVLALLGTYGAQEAWCDRKQSVGHKGIPLLSGAFVDAIPMLARLLRELGIDLAWLDEAPQVMTRRLLGGFNGVFYVSDAPTALDAKGRHVIPATEFVAEQAVKTVFGMGGFYPDGTLVVCIVFTRENLARSSVEPLASLVSLLKGETFGVVRGRKIFG